MDAKAKGGGMGKRIKSIWNSTAMICVVLLICVIPFCYMALSHTESDVLILLSAAGFIVGMYAFQALARRVNL